PKPDKEILPSLVRARIEKNVIHKLKHAPIAKPAIIIPIISNTNDCVKNKPKPTKNKIVIITTKIRWSFNLDAMIGNVNVIGTCENWLSINKYPAVDGSSPLSTSIDGTHATTV